MEGEEPVYKSSGARHRCWLNYYSLHQGKVTMNSTDRSAYQPLTGMLCSSHKEKDREALKIMNNQFNEDKVKRLKRQKNKNKANITAEEKNGRVRNWKHEWGNEAGRLEGESQRVRNTRETSNKHI